MRLRAVAGGDRRRARRGDHALRHGGHLLAGHERSRTSARALEGRRDRVLIATKFGKPMDDEPERAARLARLHPLGRRGLAAAAAHRRDRRLPDARARPEHADRRDARGAARARRTRARCGSSARSNYSARADRGGGRGRARARADAVRLCAEPLLARRARDRGRRPADVRAARHRPAAVLPARERACSRASTRVVARRPRDGSPAARSPDERWDRADAVQRYADEHGVPILHVAVGGLLALSPAVSA